MSSPLPLFCRQLCCLLALVLAFAATPALAQKLCVFDPEGAIGEGFSAARDYALAAKRWGVDLSVNVYTSEGVVVEDFKAHQCDMMVVTGLRARQFNMFTGSIDSIGGLGDYAQVRQLMNIIAGGKLDRFMISGPWEVDAVFPLGAGYVFVNDRSINKLSKAAGKRVGVMEWDTPETTMVQQIGAQPVLSDITNYGGRFNNGQVDVIVAPLILFRPFELYRGLGTKGAIVRFPIIQLTAQMVAWHDSFPEGFGRQSREYAGHQIDHALTFIHQQEEDIDPKYWMGVPSADRAGYTTMMRQARLALVEAGIYDPRMMGILKRIRCASEPDAAECSMHDE